MKTFNRRTWLKYLVIGMALFASVIVRFHMIGRTGYWYDEMISLFLAQNGDYFAIFGDNNPFLYHVFLKLWISIGSTDEMYVRTLSLIFSATTTVLLTWFGWQTIGIAGAVGFGILHIFQPLSVYHGQEARMYALFELVTAIHMIAVYNLLFSKGSQKAVIWSAILLCFTHYLGFIPVVISLLWIWRSKKRAINKKDVLLLVGAVGVGVTILAFALGFSWKHVGWQSLKYAVDPSSHHPAELFSYLGFARPVGVALLAILSMMSVWAGARNTTTKHRLIWILSYVIPPLIVFQIASIIFHRAVFIPRYFVFLIPFWIFFLTSGLVKAKPTSGLIRNVAVLLVVGLFCLSTRSELRRVYERAHSPWRDVANFLSDYKKNYILTTRGESIRSPYFDKIMIPVESWQPNQNGFSRIGELLKSYNNVWVLDTYWGSISYLSILEETLRFEKIPHYVRKFEIPGAEPLILVRIGSDKPYAEGVSDIKAGF
ncbi:MAG: hypothetical protein IT289_06820 [Oligoflexia bacterium]|nr:hypothetical protein [Oligoflexia bacterium]